MQELDSVDNSSTGGQPSLQKGHDRSSFARLLDPSFALAAVFTVTYYAVILQPGMHDSLLHRYTAEHVVEYAIVALFFWGIIDILFKCSRFPREFRALKRQWLPPFQGREPIRNATSMRDQIHTLPVWQQETKIGRCLRELLDYI